MRFLCVMPGTLSVELPFARAFITSQAVVRRALLRLFTGKATSDA